MQLLGAHMHNFHLFLDNNTCLSIITALGYTAFYGFLINPVWKSLMYNADWAHGLDSWTGVNKIAYNAFRYLLHLFWNHLTHWILGLLG